MAASQHDYDVGTAALKASIDGAIKNLVETGQIPAFAEGQAENFVNALAAPAAKATIDAVDAERAKA